MKVVIQRVKEASVNDSNKIEKGLLIYLAIHKNDTIDDIKYLVNKIVNLRIFEKDNKLNLSIKDINGSILLISQFTLYANTSNGNRPSFEDSMKYLLAKEMYNKFIDELAKTNIKYKTGYFGENMEIYSINDGPVTIIIDTKGDNNEK